MKQYLDLVDHVLATGTHKENRTGVDTLSVFNYNYTIDVSRGFPLLSTKTVPWKSILAEMLWFLSGSTDIGILHRHGCKFWDAWANPEGKVPSAYGNFWRKFPVPGKRELTAEQENLLIRAYHGLNEEDGAALLALVAAPTVAYNDQVAWAVETLKRDPSSRRVNITAWAPGNAQTSKLPPCHMNYTFNVQQVEAPIIVGDRVRVITAPKPQVKLTRWGNVTAFEDSIHTVKVDGVDEPETHSWCSLRNERTVPSLCLHLTQRSADIALGVPFNIASYALLLELFARFTGIPAGTFGHTLIDAHVYTSKPDGDKAAWNHVPSLREQLKREPRALPRLVIDPSIQTRQDVERLITDDVSTDELLRLFRLEGYDPHPAIAFRVAV